MDEAMHPLALLVGRHIRARLCRRQDGAPVRLVLPWKYGFKSIKSLVRAAAMRPGKAHGGAIFPDLPPTCPVTSFATQTSSTTRLRFATSSCRFPTMAESMKAGRSEATFFMPVSYGFDSVAIVQGRKKLTKIKA